MLAKIIISILILLLSVPSQMLQGHLLLDQKSRHANTRIHIRTVEPPPEEPFEMLLFGDAMLGRYIATLRSRYLEQDPTFPLTHLPEIIATYSEDPEIVGINLEGPITDFQISFC